jgi:hypothetical protein
MPALTGPALTAALLLVFAGAMKAVDPAMTAGALRPWASHRRRSWCERVPRPSCCSAYWR